MEELFKELAWKCYENDLHLDFQPTIYGVYISKVDEECNHTEVTQGYIGNWKLEKPTAALKRMHEELDEFIEIETLEDTKFITDNLTSYERNMKLSGMKESDFE